MKNWIKTFCLMAAFALIPAVGLAIPTTWDIDGDGIENNQDNCPDVSNEDQENFDDDFWGDACDEDDDNDGLSDEGEETYNTDPMDPDTDDDGIGDLYDCAPTDPDNAFYEDCYLIVVDGGDTSGGSGDDGSDGDDGSNPSENPPIDSDGDGCSDDVEVGMHTDPTNADTDEDGVPDCNDNCPIVHNPGQEKVEPTIDIGIECFGDYDGDGVADEDDNCIAVPNPAQLDIDGDGIGAVCDPDSEFFGGPEPLLNVQGGGGAGEGGCTLLTGAATGSSAASMMMILTTLLAFGIRRKKF